MDQSSGKKLGLNQNKSTTYIILYISCEVASLTKVLAQQPFEIADIWVQLPTEPAGD